MDWFSEATYAATDLVAGRIRGTVSAEDAAKHPIVAGGYTAQRENGYIHLNPMGYDTERDPSGWKFHLSVDPAQIKEAFNHIAPDLMKEGVFAKVGEARKHEGFGDETNPQKGKGIVIYAKEGQDITPILKQIEQKLTDAGIKPGPAVNDDKKLGGSNFLFYRNDRDQSGRYIEAARVQNLPSEQRFNPTGKSDPYQSVDVSPSRTPLKPAAQSADSIKFPGEKASPEEHLKYLIDVTKHIQNSSPPADEIYRQRTHGDGVTIGDPQKPAMLNASYPYGNRALASISYPDYIKMEYGVKVSPTGDITMAKGLSNLGIASSLQAVLKSQGIQVDGGETKVGHDKMSGTNYIEMDLTDKKKYAHAVAIMDAITQGRDKSPEAVMAQIKSINPTNPIRPIPPDPISIDNRKILAATTPTFTDKGTYLGVGAKPAEFEAIQKALKQQGMNEGIDYKLKPSSLNGGNNVIALTPEGTGRVLAIQKEHSDAMHASKQLLATAEPTHTQKGTYLGVGASPTEFEDLKKAITQQGFKEGADYQIKPSAVNGGNNVIAFSGEAGLRVLALQAEHQVKITPVAAAVRPEQIHLDEASKRAREQLADPNYKPAKVSTPVDIDLGDMRARPSPASAQPSVQTATPAIAPPTATASPIKPQSNMPPTTSAFNGASSIKDQPLPHNPTPMMGSLALAPEPQIPLNLKPAQQQQIVNPATAPVAANTADSGTSPKVSLGASGQKVDGHAGKASLAIQVASEAAKGNYVAAASTAAVAIAEQQGLKFVAKRVPVLGGVITAGMTLWSAGAEAAQGNFKKAGSELVGGAAETVGNIVGFGAGDALREVARKGMMVAGVREENAPNKSGIRVAAETAYEMGKTIKDAAQLRSMSKTDLAKTIQSDTTLPQKLNLRGQEVTLVQAMEDKTFRTTMIKNMEAEAKKNPALDTKIAALKEYSARLDATAPVKTASATATTAVTTPATPALKAMEAQYKSMSPTQLASAIQTDQTLVDTVKIGKNDVLLSDALKDKGFRKSFLDGLEKAQANGTDLQEQIAMVKAYDTALAKPLSSAPNTQLAQAPQQQPKASAPAMG